MVARILLYLIQIGHALPDRRVHLRLVTLARLLLVDPFVKGVVWVERVGPERHQVAVVGIWTTGFRVDILVHNEALCSLSRVLVLVHHLFAELLVHP